MAISNVPEGERLTNEAERGLLKFEHSPHSADSPSVIIVDGQEHRTVEIFERELIIQLREALAREGGELRIGRGDCNQGTRFTVLFF